VAENAALRHQVVVLRRRVHLDQVFPDILFKQDGQLDLIDPK